MNSILSSLLPGVREIRAPLIGGYLWLCTVWLAVGPSLPPRAETTGVVQDVLELADRVPGWVVFAVLSVVAYLIGTLVEDLVRLARDKQRATANIEYPWEGKRPLAKASPPSDTSLQLLVSERVRAAQGTLKTVGEDLSDLPEVLIREEQSYYDASGGATWHDDEDMRESQLTAALHGQTLRELSLVRFRLMGDEPVLYGNVDRTRAEAELRLAVAVPLFAIGIVLALRTGPFWVSVAIGAGLTIVAGILLWQAAERERRANDAVVDAIFIDKVQSPGLDQLRRATDEVMNESDLQRTDRKQRQAQVRAEQKRDREAREKAEGEAYGDAGVGC